MSPACASQLIAALRTCLSCPAALLSSKGELLASTHPMEPAFLASSFLARHSDASDLSLLCVGADGDSFLFFPEGDPGETVRRYAKTISGLISRQHETHWRSDNDYSDRLYLIYQLTMLGPSNGESLSLFASRLKYDPNVLRCAILFHTSTTLDYFYYQEGHQFFLQSVPMAPGYCREDIYELLSFNQMIVFKAFPDISDPIKAREAAIHFASAITEAIEAGSGLKVRACIGSFYPNIANQHESYKQARFLLYNADLLNDTDRVMLIDNHVFEYLFSLLPAEYWRKKFRRFSVIEEQSALADTLISLSRNNINLANTAKELGLHRNTVNNRYARLRDLLNIDLQSSDKDRLEVRQYALFRKAKTVLHAGSNIQHGSIIHMGFCKFAEFISHLSGGSLEVDLHVISNSGDNQNLVEILLGGSLDFAALDFNAIAPHSQNRITVFQLPFLFDSSEEAFDVLDGEFGQSLAESLLPSGLVHLGFWSMGWRMFTTNQRPIRTPEDLSGLRLRIMHKNIVASYMESLGVRPIKMHYKDIYPALVQRLIDGQENPYGNIMAMKLHTNQNYISEIPMFFDVVTLLSTSNALNNCSPEQQAIIRQAAEMTTDWQHREVERFNNKYRDELVRCGLTIIPFDRHTLPVWRKTAQPFYDAFEPHDTLDALIRAKEAYHAKHRI